MQQLLDARFSLCALWSWPGPKAWFALLFKREQKTTTTTTIPSPGGGLNGRPISLQLEAT